MCSYSSQTYKEQVVHTYVCAANQFMGWEDLEPQSFNKEDSQQ